MRPSTPALLLLSLLLMLAPAGVAQAAGDRAHGEATVAAKSKQKGKAQPRKGKAQRKRCRKGYVLRTVKVKRKGKTVRVKRCRKKPAPPKKPAAPPAKPNPAPGGPPGPSAEEAARTLVMAKLANTRFTNCPAGWPTGCIVEFRYSHFADGTFVYCRVTPGPMEVVQSTFELRSPRVGDDGSWSFETNVPDHGAYRWQVTAGGQVTGSFLESGEDRFTDLFPLQHIAGARDCSI